MRAARLIKMVLLLQSRSSMTAAELAGELEVSERTVTRDAQALSEAGIPVYAERGRAGGYRLVGGYRTRLTGLARGEAEALFLSGVPGALREMGLEDAASAARLKVSAALQPSLRDASRSAAQRFHLDAPNWFAEPATPELLPAVADAVWDDRRITARYRRTQRDGRAGREAEPGAGPETEPGAGPETEREVERELEPYGLVLKAGVWYLCARVADAGAFRVYRIDRFTAVAPGEERFTRDEAFDLPAFWQERAEQFARSLLRAEVVVRLSGEGVRRLPYAVDPRSARQALAAAGAPDRDGLVTATLSVESEEVAHGQLTGLGPEVEVLAPAGLRERFARDAARFAGLYRS
ncbi:YafY family transcriptional regulator [Streptomyces adustus]|uniref:YafY family transcriptional regulator n=1 Tax=Streptomyces adustus TaxID=1609272 RepID=A0A5N8VGK5_9ACTN|nr:YafY family protein [Streptomyces adustus]MPY33198.1 YafY family transcriptional regulator [Streptomyces adustus]